VLFGIFTEYFWYESLGFASRSSTEIWTKIGLFLGWNYSSALRAVRPGANRIIPLAGAFVLAVIMGSWAAGL